METQGIFTQVVWIAQEFQRQNTIIQTIFNFEKSWKTSRNAEEPLQKKQHFANLESEDFLLAKNINKGTKFPALIWKSYIYL